MALFEQLDIQSVAFGQNSVEIVYAEARDIDNKSGIIEYRTLVVPADMVADAAIEALDSISQLIDAAQIAKRNPAASIRS